ncbi:MAG: hypothetical protein C4522_08575 [Desulfobacteraceae bacterium]|nr:MAG: hypothetical protein C4522_08575 [Desulfobacteraceae bacterium]
MMIVDSCGWLEWFTDGDLADQYKPYLSDQDNLLIPAIILYEVYKVLPEFCTQLALNGHHDHFL